MTHVHRTEPAELVEMTMMFGDEVWLDGELFYRHAGLGPVTIKVPRRQRVTSKIVMDPLWPEVIGKRTITLWEGEP